MGWSFRKSFKVAPGVRLNLSKRGLGASFGVKGVHVGVGSGRKARLTGGVGPFRYYKTIGGATASHHADQGTPAVQGCIVGLIKAVAIVVLLLIVLAAVVAAFHLRMGGQSHSSVPATGPSASTPSPSFEERVSTSQQEAIRKYPDLTKVSSALNQRFLREHQRLRLAASKQFLDAGWPLWLADECAVRIKNLRLPPIPLE